MISHPATTTGMLKAITAIASASGVRLIAGLCLRAAAFVAAFALILLESGFDFMNPMPPPHSIGSASSATIPSWPRLRNLESAFPGILTPSALRRELTYPSALTGTGVTVGVLAAQLAFSQRSLDHFTRVFRLPPCHVRVYDATSAKTLRPFRPRAGLLAAKAETMLDIEWLHAVAPGARIDLIVWHRSTKRLTAAIHAVAETVGFYLYGPFSLPWRLLPWGVLRRLDERLASPRNSGRRAV